MASQKAFSQTPGFSAGVIHCMSMIRRRDQSALEEIDKANGYTGNGLPELNGLAKQ